METYFRMHLMIAWQVSDRQQNVRWQDLLQVNAWHDRSYIAGIPLATHGLNMLEARMETYFGMHLMIAWQVRERERKQNQVSGRGRGQGAARGLSGTKRLVNSYSSSSYESSSPDGDSKGDYELSWFSRK